jgi:DNA-directed RNA polymerase subunit N (RpoN/RPB10)
MIAHNYNYYIKKLNKEKIMDIYKQLDQLNDSIKQSYCEHKFQWLKLDTEEIAGELGLKSATCRKCSKVLSAYEFHKTYYKSAIDI